MFVTLIAATGSVCRCPNSSNCIHGICAGCVYQWYLSKAVCPHMVEGARDLSGASFIKVLGHFDKKHPGVCPPRPNWGKVLLQGHSRGCWQDSVPCWLMDEGPPFPTDCCLATLFSLCFHYGSRLPSEGAREGQQDSLL